MPVKVVSIDLEAHYENAPSYDIYIGSGLIAKLGEHIPQDVAHTRFFLIADENTKGYAQQIQKILKSGGAREYECLTLNPGEKTKSFGVFQSTCEWLLEQKIDRQSVVMAVGGGVIGDLAGYAASSVLRGVPYIQVPTSLLAQVDSSVGGKTGINCEKGKNLIGAFYHPQAVVADLDTLKTLPKRELLAGYAEVLKYGLIGDYDFFTWLEDNGSLVCDLDGDALTYAVEQSVQAKAAIVRADEREQGRRALLNLGHTFGHALEAAAGYDGTLLHGEAVAIGMVMAFDLSARMELCKMDDMHRVESHLQSIGLPTRASAIDGLSTSVQEQLGFMAQDKKVQDGKMRFILANEIGNALVSDNVSEELVWAVIVDSLGGEEKKGSKSPSSTHGLINKAFTNKGVKGLWRSAFSSQISGQ